MSDTIIHDDGSDFRPTPPRPEPDAHGQAALLLAEATLHALVEMDILTVAQAIDIVRTASEVKVDVAEETGESRGLMQQSLGLLAGIEGSLTAGEDGADGAA